MQNENLLAAIGEFLKYLRVPTSLEQLQDDKAVLNHPALRKIKAICAGNLEASLKTMEAIARNIQQLDTFKTGFAAKSMCDGIDLTQAHPFITDFTIGLLLRYLVLTDRYLFQVLKYIENDQIALSSPHEIKAWKCIDAVTEPASIVLSTNVSARKKFRENKNYFPLLQRLKNYVIPIEIIFNLYRLTDETEIILLHPQKLVGFRMIATGIQNNFHFFTLAQHELAQKVGGLLGISPSIHQDAVQLAKGLKKFDIHRKFPDTALLHFYHWRAYYESEKRKMPLSPQYLLAGSNTPMGISGIEGRKIVILGEVSKPHLQWDTSAFRPFNQYLTAQVELKNILDKNIVTSILKKIQSLNIPQ